MRSTVAFVLVAFACGVAALQVCAALPPFPAAIVLAALALMLVQRHRAWTACVAAGLLGFGYAAWRAEARLGDALPAAWEAQDIRLTGIVDDLPTLLDDGVRFAFAVERVLTPRASAPSRISLAWYDYDSDEAPPVVRAGERWTLTVRLKRPHGNVNPGGFDLEAWLLQHNLRATGYVAQDERNARLDAFVGRWRDHVQRAREDVRARIRLALADADYAGVIVALAIGDQRAIPEAQWTVFNRTGIGHLMSISGLHVTVFAAFAGGLAFLLARRCVTLTSRVPARKVAAAVGLACAGAYTLLAGAEVPAFRTFAMLTVAAAGLWFGRPGTAGIVWLWALAAVLAVDPWAPLAPGFWLSYGAVALLLYATTGRLRDGHAEGWRSRLLYAVRESAQAQWVVTVGLTPLTLALFGQTSLIAPVANAFAIPAVTLVVVPLTLTGIVLPFAFPLEVAHAALSPLMALLEWLSALPDATWQQHAPPLWTVVAGCVGALWLLAPFGVPARACGALWLLPLFVVTPPRLPDGAFRLVVLDVGQGLSAIVETRGHTLVYDTGPGFGDVTDAGGRIVAPYLRARGLRRADALIVSHQDLDHSGGALSLMHATPIGFLASSLPDEHPIVARARARTASVSCIAGQSWTWDGVRFSVIHPTTEAHDDRHLRSNDRSCVVRVASPHGSVLLTGDIEARTEALLVRSQPDALRVDVMVVPHHGSRTSSSHPFVQAVNPAIAVIGCGYRNRFGHPRADIVARYTNRGIAIARTDLEGAVSVDFDGRAPLQVEGARAQRRRYWLQ